MTINRNQNLLAMAAAILLSVVSVGSAVGPAHAIETSPRHQVA